MEGRVAVEELGKRTDAVTEHFVLVSDHLSFDEAQTSAFIEFQAGFDIESEEPRPCRSLMIGVVALCLWSYIHGVVSAALWRQRAESFWREQFFGADVDDIFFLFLREWRIVKGSGEDHVGSDAPVLFVAVDIIEEIAELVDEGSEESVFCLVGLLVQAGGKVVVMCFLCEFGAEAECVVPQSVELHYKSCARHHRASVGRRVHPGDSAFRAVGFHEAVVGNEQVGMFAVRDI